MRSLSLWFLGWICLGFSLQAGEAKILKVLPHYLDLEGHHALSPSLYERDAYQAYLRKHPEKCSALRFDINWKSKRGESDPLLKIEIRGSHSDLAQPIVLQRAVHPGFFSKWSSLMLDKDAYTKAGQLVAWRVTLWQGEQLLAEQKSFLW